MDMYVSEMRIMLADLVPVLIPQASTWMRQNSGTHILEKRPLGVSYLNMTVSGTVMLKIPRIPQARSFLFHQTTVTYLPTFALLMNYWLPYQEGR